MEAVVALPVFVILFVGMFFVRDLAGAKLEAKQQARRCAWQYSYNACDASAGLPAGCEDLVRDARPKPLDSRIGDAISSAKDGIKSGLGKEAMAKILSELVESALGWAFDKKTEANVSIERERPALFGGGKSQIAGKYRLACNVKKSTQGDIVNAAWARITPWKD